MQPGHIVFWTQDGTKSHQQFDPTDKAAANQLFDSLKAAGHKEAYMVSKTTA